MCVCGVQAVFVCVWCVCVEGGGGVHALCVCVVCKPCLCVCGVCV